jgi:hypothetical protein
MEGGGRTSPSQVGAMHRQTTTSLVSVSMDAGTEAGMLGRQASKQG